jgi:hypothetical protein
MVRANTRDEAALAWKREECRANVQRAKRASRARAKRWARVRKLIGAVAPVLVAVSPWAVSRLADAGGASNMPRGQCEAAIRFATAESRAAQDAAMLLAGTRMSPDGAKVIS